MKFGSLPELIDRIKADIGLAKKQLDREEHMRVASDRYFAL